MAPQATNTANCDIHRSQDGNGGLGYRTDLEMVAVEPIGTPVKGGEGPHWDAAHQVLYFVDNRNALVNKYDPATKTQTSVKVAEGSRVSLVVPVEGKRDQFLISVDRSLAVMTWDGKSPKPAKVEVLCSVHEDEHGDQAKHFNDGKVDPAGRFWAGTLGQMVGLEVKSKGSLFSFSKDWKPTAHVDGLLIANGPAWSPDGKTMYHGDSLARVVEAFDFNAEKGELANRRILLDFKKNDLADCYPDGMTVDTEGNLWVACFAGGQVIRVDTSSGKVLTTVKIPSPETTSVAFGGRDLDELYVTSANIRLSEEDLKKYPLAGSAFRVTGLGVKGVPAKNVQLP